LFQLKVSKASAFEGLTLDYFGFGFFWLSIMGLFRKQKVEYFYLEKNLKGVTVKYGPFTFEQIALVSSFRTSF